MHPELGCAVCARCLERVGREFELDADGYELQCRWCGVGGELIGCNSCVGSFCRGCIGRNFGGVAAVAAVLGEEDWSCYRCDPSALAGLTLARRPSTEGRRVDVHF